jgi:hypothetical protein
MLDPIQIPILLKAVDFVFEEGRKILEERRERRKLNENASKSEVQESEKDATQTPDILQEQAETKQDLLTSKIEAGLWRDHEQEVQHLVRLLETYSRNYHLAQEQYAKWGSALVPPIILHNLTEAENSMLGTIKQLEAVLSKVYKKDIQPIQ